MVDDDRFLTRSIGRILEVQNFQVEVAHTLEESRNKIVLHPPDLLILDLNLPDGDGLKLCRNLRQEFTFPILMLTSRGASVDKVVGLEAGADDYLVKPFDPFELVARVKALLRRQNNYDKRTSPGNGGLIVRGQLVIDLAARLASIKGEPLSLTQTEFDLLHHLADTPGKAIHRDQIFEAVWGYSPDFSSNSLDVLMYRLRAKLRAAAQSDLIQTVRGYGFRFVEQTSATQPE